MLIIFINLYAFKLPKYFQSDFNQTITSNKNTLIYRGKLFYYKGNILWKYIFPMTKYIWITDKIYVYEPDLMQVTIHKRGDSIISNILNNYQRIEKNSYSTKFNNINIYFTFDKYLGNIHYKDEIGNDVNISFYNQTNKEFNTSILIPNFSKDVEIIEYN